jgi:hypothetical protein
MYIVLIANVELVILLDKSPSFAFFMITGIILPCLGEGVKGLESQGVYF